jgi:hypothetical protein
MGAFRCCAALSSSLAHTLRVLVASWFWVFALLVPVAAAAHDLDANRAIVRLAGDTVYAVVTPSSKVFAQCDDDGNGLLHVDEVAKHRQELIDLFDSNFRVANEDGVEGKRTFRDVSTPHALDGVLPAGADHMRFTFKYQWPLPPKALRVQWKNAKHQPLVVRAVRARPSKLIHEQTPLGPAEIVRLEAMRPGHLFFKAALDAAKARETAGPIARVTDSPFRALAFGGLLALVVTLLCMRVRRMRVRKTAQRSAK